MNRQGEERQVLSLTVSAELGSGLLSQSLAWLDIVGLFHLPDYGQKLESSHVGICHYAASLDQALFPIAEEERERKNKQDLNYLKCL